LRHIDDAVMIQPKI